ncbi:MAG: methyltransferase domain-containing protein [Planctomycetota bacterium]
MTKTTKPRTRRFPIRRRLVQHCLVAAQGLLLLTFAGVGHAQEKSVKPGINDPFKDPDLKKFQETFEGESREIFAKRAEIASACHLKPGMKVADIGAGTGLFTRLFATSVGADGRVYAVDISQKFLDHIAAKCKEEKLSNVTYVLCTATSTELPPASIDVAFVCDTYHHFEFPYRTLASIHQALKPNGQLIVIDFHRIEGKSRDWVLQHVRAGEEVFKREILEAGFEPAGKETMLSENYFLRFRKRPMESKAGEP